MSKEVKIGDLVMLKKLYQGHGDKCIILNVYKDSMPGEGGWISFTYEAITNKGEIINLTESCIKCVVKNGRATGT
tara:strand:- start:25 stop:249 length:225 start_codon:yes stop_codon:yes gene_type:complete